MLSPASQKVRRGRENAFSLVEVVLAIGIVAFAVIPVMGLLPIGMNTYRNAVDMTVGARIGQQIAGEIAMAGSSPAPDERYFNVLGQETAAGNFESVYYVNVVPEAASKLPGDAGGDRALTRVVVEVCYNPAQTLPARDEAGRIVRKQGQQIREYSFYTAR